MEWSPQQDKALIAFKRWFANRGEDDLIFHLYGYAGTGKSSIALELTQGIDGPVIFAAFTGKAASVMRKRGCSGAQTLHSLLYNVRKAGAARLLALEEEKVALLAGGPEFDTRELTRIEREMAEARKAMNKPAWDLNPFSDARKAALIVVDECFVAGTLIDTPDGARRVEELTPGECILNAAGEDYVLATLRKEASSLAQIKSGSTTITCSETHRFFTQRGLVCAAELKPGDTLLSTGEAVRLLREITTRTGAERESSPEVLLDELQLDLVDAICGAEGESTQSGSMEEVRRGAEAFLAEWFSGSSSPDAANSADAPDAGHDCKDQSHGEGQRPYLEGARRQRLSDDAFATVFADGSSGRGLDTGVSHQDGAKTSGVRALLQSGFGEPRIADRDRIGRQFPQLSAREGTRCPAGRSFEGARVESVEIFQQGDPRLDRYRDANGKLYLYDLQAARHSSFSVEGCLVHNCSMVDERLGGDLLSFRRPILVLGDPAQLPPVKGAGFFNTLRPEVMLTEVHRHALDNPILHLATKIRMGERLEHGSYGESRIVRAAQLSGGETMQFDQILVGRNNTRQFANRKMRERLGYQGLFPLEGEKLVCLKNNRENGLLNGTLWTVNSCVGDEDSVEITVTSEEGAVVETLAHGEPFLYKDAPRWGNGGMDEFTYGYAMTTHKAQGSEWPTVYLVDESSVFRGDADKWLYTAVTRASEKLLMVRS